MSSDPFRDVESDERERRRLDSALAAANAVVDEEALVVHSDIWPRDGGVYDWELQAGDHTATGQAASVNACHDAMTEQLADWFPTEMAEAGGAPFLVVRIVED